MAALFLGNETLFPNIALYVFENKIKKSSMNIFAHRTFLYSNFYASANSITVMIVSSVKARRKEFIAPPDPATAPDAIILCIEFRTILLLSAD